MCTGTFAISNTEMPIVSITVADLSTFAEWAGSPTAVKEFVPGVGDAAYFGPSTAKEPTVLVFRKGTRAVRFVSTKKDGAGERMVNNEQLLEFARLVSSRM